jgi:predicted cobalt transporter CbtA
MVRSLLVRGMLAGLLAGLLAFGVAKLIGEPQVDKAIAFESALEAQADHGAHDHGDDEIVSRSLQSSAGLGAGALLLGVAMGGIFALVFAIAYGRLGPLTAKGTAAVLGLLGFVAVYLVPFLKYPANPPAIGDPDTIGRRTELYLLMIVASIVLMVLAVMLRRRLRFRIGEWNSTLVAAGVYVAAVIVCFVVFPGINEVPQRALEGVVGAVTDAGTTFPPVVLWRFRVASLTIQATIWATIAIAFGYLAQSRLASDPAYSGAADMPQGP